MTTPQTIAAFAAAHDDAIRAILLGAGMCFRDNNLRQRHFPTKILCRASVAFHHRFFFVS